MKLGKLLFALSLLNLPTILFAKTSTSIDPKNPVSLCERFIVPQAKAACEKKIEKWGPDWYLASVCEKQFDDSLFFNCLQLSQSKNFSPVALETCNADGLSDQERLSCLTKSGVQHVYQDVKLKAPQRIPASRRAKTLPAKISKQPPLEIGSDPN